MKALEAPWLSRSLPEPVVWILVFVVVLIFRSLYSVPIEMNDESIGKWLWASIWDDDGSLSEFTEESQHSRWGVIAAQYIVVNLFPNRIDTYYYLPIIFYSAFTTICTRIFFQATNNVVFSLLLLLALCIDPMSHVSASQSYSSAFGLFYLIVGVSSLSVFLDRKNTGYLFVSALFFFFAYGCHQTYGLFIAAPLVYLTINKRLPYAAVKFLLFFFLLLLAETGVFYLLSDFQLVGGQLQISQLWAENTVSHKFLARVPGDAPKTTDIFLRWLPIPKFNLLILVFFYASIALSLIYTKKFRLQLSPGLWILTFSAALYGLFVTFAYRDLEPLRPFIPFHSSYLILFFPLATPIVIYFSYKALQLLFPINLLKMAGLGGFLAISLVFFIGTETYNCGKAREYIHWGPTVSQFLNKSYCSLFSFSREQNIYPSRDQFIFRANTYYDSFFQDYLRGEVSIPESRLGHFRLLFRAKNIDVDFVERENLTGNDINYLSIDGSETDYCISEFNQTDTTQDNYYYCRDTRFRQTND